MVTRASGSRCCKRNAVASPTIPPPTTATRIRIILSYTRRYTGVLMAVR